MDIKHSLAKNKTSSRRPLIYGAALAVLIIITASIGFSWRCQSIDPNALTLATVQQGPLNT
ncbi:hypothetical protein [Pseudoalteromonas ruthenica]|uniref:hypothetical protein n=1 Tax=Pseudoalteromonas ruthenica TaxID=151081 RepID=UPI00110B5D51|nr:hypothetical protein [Pseudoalteromonas ruthenica]TMO48357.1 hypothetical protein CWC23_17890 [Pseudoalteromonas ruthenica]TMO48757.1 hypothetical protein CWC24_03585 [Pseudoalteromonas ruthenica]